MFHLGKDWWLKILQAHNVWFGIQFIFNFKILFLSIFAQSIVVMVFVEIKSSVQLTIMC